MSEQQRSRSASAAGDPDEQDRPSDEQEPIKPPEGGESSLTVIVALAANVGIALAKSFVAFLTGSASMIAEAAHSWADSGNEVLLLIAEKRGKRPRDEAHPRGYGRVTYIWSLVAAFGLFSAGAVVSIWHGISEISSTAVETEFTANYIVLGIAFLLEGTSFVQATRQVRGASRSRGLHPLRYVDVTSDPTVRAVFAEDASALIGIVIAVVGIALHQVTGNAIYDAIGSILIGVLLGCVAIFLMRRNMQYLLGEGLSPALRQRVVDRVREHPDVDRLTYLHVEYVGPQKLFVVAAVDLTGDDAEPDLARRLRKVEKDLEDYTVIEDAVLTLSLPEDPDLDLDAAAPAERDLGRRSDPNSHHTV